MINRNANTINLRTAGKAAPVNVAAPREQYGPADYLATAIRSAELDHARDDLDPYSAEYQTATLRATAMRDQRDRIAAVIFNYSKEDLFYHER